MYLTEHAYDDVLKKGKYDRFLKDFHAGVKNAPMNFRCYIAVPLENKEAMSAAYMLGLFLHSVRVGDYEMSDDSLKNNMVDLLVNKTDKLFTIKAVFGMSIIGGVKQMVSASGLDEYTTYSKI